MEWDLDQLRKQIQKFPANYKIKKLRLRLFDLYRYQEDYEKIWKLIKDLKKE